MDSWCKDCHKRREKRRPKRDRSKQQRGYYEYRKEADPYFILRGNLKQFYNITLEQYLEMYEKQDGKCAVCGEEEVEVHHATGERRRLAVDHDHNCCPGRESCGRCIRGLLCNACNRGLGLLNDSVERLERAIGYLDKYEYSQSD